MIRTEKQMIEIVANFGFKPAAVLRLMAGTMLSLECDFDRYNLIMNPLVLTIILYL